MQTTRILPRSTTLLVVITALASAGEPTAQIIAPPPAAGYGGILREFDGFAATGNNNLHAVAFLGGMFYIAGSVAPGTHRIYVVNDDGTPAGSFLQPAAQQTSSTGILDLTTDGTSLIGGSDSGISVFDISGAPVAQVMAASGPQAVVNPVTGGGLTTIGSYAAVSFDPAGNGGFGSFRVTNGTSDILDIDTSGTVLATIPNPGWDTSGMDGPEPCQGRWWLYSRATGRIEEMDASGAPTGHSVPGLTGGGVPAGLAVVSPFDPRTRWYNSYQLVSLYRSTPPRIAIHRIHGVEPFPRPIPPPPGWLLHGADEVFLEIGNGAASGRGPLPILPGNPITLQLNDTGEPGVIGFPWFVAINAGPATLLNPTTFYGPVVFPEWVVASPFSVPPGPAIVQFVFTGAPLTIPLPPSLPPPSGALVKVQAVYLNTARGDPRLDGLVATNPAYFVY